MIQYMLDKLSTETNKYASLQQDGNFSAAHAGYELVCEALRYYRSLGYLQEVAAIHRIMLAVQPTPALTLYMHALILLHLRELPAAEAAINSAITLEPNLALMHDLKAQIEISKGDLPAAQTAYNQAHALYPTSGGIQETHLKLTAEQEMPGEDYYFWLQRFHESLQPKTYVEIGLGHGRSLALAGPRTLAIGIDPYQGNWERLNYVSPHSPATLFPLTSDDFFVRHDLRQVIGKDTFDLAFIDGLHLFEQVLNDFINLERYARKDSVILIHDCLPIAPIVAERDRRTGFWTGDVWRIIPCLKSFRPDLRIVTIPTKPSGLAVVTNLDPTSQVLADQHEVIVNYYLRLNCPESFEQRRAVCNVTPADWAYISEKFCKIS